MIQLYLNSIDQQIYDLKKMGLSSDKIKSRLIKKYRNQYLYNSFQTKNWLLIYEFIVNNKQIGCLKFCK